MTEKLRVVHIITQLELGGAQRNTLYTVENLDAGRTDVWLLSGSGGLLDDEVRNKSFTTIFISCLQRRIHPLLDLIAAGQLYHALRRIRPHVVHTHSSKAGILGRFAAYFAGVPVIVHTFHGFGFTPTQPKRVRNLYLHLERWFAYLATHLVFVSKDNLEEALKEKLVGRGSHSLIRSGITVRAAPDIILNREVRQEVGVPSNAWVVVSVGNFKPQKNPSDLIKIACETAAIDPSIHFLLIGDGEQRVACETQVRNASLDKNIHFLGWRKDARSFLTGSDCFLLTSLWEGLPRALVEAFEASLPAVAYAVNGVKDILTEGESGFPIVPGDTSVAVQKLLWLKSHPQDARRMGEAGRARVEKEFDIDQMVYDQQALYERLWNAVPLKEYYNPSTPTALSEAARSQSISATSGKPDSL